LYKQSFIRKIASAFLLLVFAFSITPVVVFHNWLASHTDSYRKAADSKTPQQLGKQTFNCHCDHVVAESPFTETVILTSAAPAQQFADVIAVDIIQFPASPGIFYSLRGPPVV